MKNKLLSRFYFDCSHWNNGYIRKNVLNIAQRAFLREMFILTIESWKYKQPLHAQFKHYFYDFDNDKFIVKNEG